MRGKHNGRENSTAHRRRWDRARLIRDERKDDTDRYRLDLNFLAPHLSLTGPSCCVVPGVQGGSVARAKYASNAGPREMWPNAGWTLFMLLQQRQTDGLLPPALPATVQSHFPFRKNFSALESSLTPCPFRIPYFLLYSNIYHCGPKTPRQPSTIEEIVTFCFVTWSAEDVAMARIVIAQTRGGEPQFEARPGVSYSPFHSNAELVESSLKAAHAT